MTQCVRRHVGRQSSEFCDFLEQLLKARHDHFMTSARRWKHQVTRAGQAAHCVAGGVGQRPNGPAGFGVAERRRVPSEVDLIPTARQCFAGAPASDDEKTSGGNSCLAIC